MVPTYSFPPIPVPTHPGESAREPRTHPVEAERHSQNDPVVVGVPCCLENKILFRISRTVCQQRPNTHPTSRLTGVVSFANSHQLSPRCSSSCQVVLTPLPSSRQVRLETRTATGCCHFARGLLLEIFYLHISRTKSWKWKSLHNYIPRA